MRDQRDYERVAETSDLVTCRLPVEGGHLYVTMHVRSPDGEGSVATTFVPRPQDPATVADGQRAEGLSDVTRARLRLEQAQNTASSDRIRALVDEALALLGGPVQ